MSFSVDYFYSIYVITIPLNIIVDDFTVILDQFSYQVLIHTSCPVKAQKAISYVSTHIYLKLVIENFYIYSSWGVETKSI